MSIDLTQQALNALADAGLGNDSPAEAYVIGYTQGHDDALALAIQLERSINRRPFMPDEAERLPPRHAPARAGRRLPDCPRERQGHGRQRARMVGQSGSERMDAH